jgi:hypothetical protein
VGGHRCSSAGGGPPELRRGWAAAGAEAWVKGRQSGGAGWPAGADLGREWPAGADLGR